MTRTVTHACKWKCAHWCCFPFCAALAPVPSVTSHWLQCPHNPPCGHSSQCQSNADSGPKSVMLMLRLCVLLLIDVYWCVCLCVCAHSCMCFSIFGGGLFFRSFFFFFFGFIFSFPLKRRQRHEGVSLQWQREEWRSESTERKSGGAQQQQQAEGKEDDSAF